MAELEEAAEIASQLHAESPTDPAYQALRGRVLIELGRLPERDTATAVKNLKAAIDLLAAVPEGQTSGKRASFERDLFSARHALFRILRKDETQHQEALEIGEALLAEYPLDKLRGKDMRQAMRVFEIHRGVAEILREQKDPESQKRADAMTSALQKMIRRR